MQAMQAPPEKQTTPSEVEEKPPLEDIKQLVDTPTQTKEQTGEVDEVEQQAQHPTRLSIEEMRDMVGLASGEARTPHTEPVSIAHAERSQTRVAPQTDSNADLVDEGDFASDEALATKRKIWQSPLLKLALIAGGIGLACLLLAAIFRGIGQATLSADERQTTEAETAVVETANDTAQSPEAEIARLKTSNALGNQASIINSQPTRSAAVRPVTRPAARISDPAQITQRQPPAIAQPETATPSPQAQPQRSRPVAVARSAAIPTTRVASSSREATATAVAPAKTAASLRPNVAEATAHSDVDPYQQQQQLTAAGSYGQVTTTPIANSETAVATEVAPTEAQTPEAIPILVSNATATNKSATAHQSATATRGRPLPKAMEAGDRHREVSYELVLDAVSIESLEVEPVEDVQLASYEAGVEFIMRNSESATSLQETIILPGSSAAGQVIVPVAIAQDIQSSVGVIELTDDLISNGSVIMPAGTQLTVELGAMSSSGMMQLVVTAIVLPRSGYEHMQIPPTAISVQGTGGAVLMAKDISGADAELRRLERNQALLGALGTVGSILNRPSGSISTVTVGGASSSTTYDSPNILGAVLEGSANTLIAQRTAQNQQRATQLQQRPSVWVLEQGTPIEIFINQPITIGG